MEIVVEKAEGLKCPRCWRFWGISENPEGICDRCAEALLNSTPKDYYSSIKDLNDLSVFHQNFLNKQEEIRQALKQQALKYRHSKPIM